MSEHALTTNVYGTFTFSCKCGATVWVIDTVRQPHDCAYPDADQPIEHVADRHGYIWRIVRDGGMATRAHETGLVSIGIAALERAGGPLTRVVPPAEPAFSCNQCGYTSDEYGDTHTHVIPPGGDPA